MLGQVLHAFVLSFCGLAFGWQVLQDTDFTSNLPGLPYGPGASASDCADQCNAMSNCVAASWNSPQSPSHDGNCNFKCSVADRVAIKGEQAVIVRPQAGDTCDLPPQPLPPKDPDWAKRHAAGHLLFSPSLANLMPFVGNGYLATHPLHASAGESGTLFIAGVFNGVAVQFPCENGFCSTPHRARVPTYRVEVPDSQTSATYAAAGGFALDIELATLVRRYSASQTLKIESRFYAHMARRNVLIHELILDNALGTEAATVPLQAVVGADSIDIDFEKKTSNGIYEIYGEVRHAETPMLNKTAVALAANVAPENVTVAAGHRHSCFFITAVATSLDSQDPSSAALSYLQEALSSTPSLRTSHEAAWLSRWEQGHLEISGNLPLAQAVNASMYFIMSSLRSDWPQGLSPGGLASDGYNGHSFWDCETWMYPNLLLLQPDLAKSMLRYRLDRLDGARAKALSHGYAGVMFPWESAFSGYEVQGDAGGKIGPWGQFEQHITGDIALAASQYWQTSGDEDFLRSDIEPLLRGIGDFWASRVEVGADGRYHINHVMCPDEYHSDVNDSVYTNWVAKLSLQAAIDASHVVGKEPGANWSKVSELLSIPFDEQLSYHPEYAGYKEGTKIKQGDAILLGFPLLLNMSAEVRANDLKAYSAVTDANGPAMTWAMFSVGWLEAGDISKAQQNFIRGYANSQPPFNVWTETPHGGTVNFITGAGGFLQSVLYGYGGLRVRAACLDLSPPLPPADTSAVIMQGVNYHGNRLRIAVTRQEVSISLVSTTHGAEKLCLRDVSGKSVPLPEQGSTLTRARAGRYAICPRMRSLPITYI